MRELDQRLTVLAIEPTLWPVTRPALAVVRAPIPVRRAAMRPRLRRPRITLGAIAGATLVLGSSLLVTGSSTHELPILRTDTADARSLGSDPTFQGLGVDLGKAHEVHSKAGTAYVLTSPSHDKICLVIPDPNTAVGDGYGGSCRSTSAVEHHGLLVEAVAVRSRGTVVKNGVGFVLPIGASHPVIVDGVSRRTPAVDHGVIAEITHGAGVLSYTLASSRHQVILQGPFPAANGPCDAAPGRPPSPNNCR